ncbi:MAG: S1 RNA-binding domain-containing protein, partial [Gammaproteobacteria bacterium]
MLEKATRESYSRIMRSSVEDDLLVRLKERSDGEAILVFQKNLANLLLSPPGGAMVVMGMDPAATGGCRIAVVDEAGKFRAEAVLQLRRGNPKAELPKAVAQESSGDSGSRQTGENSTSEIAAAGAALPEPPPPSDGAESSPNALTAADAGSGASAATNPPASNDPRVTLKELIALHQPRALAIGEGNGSREIETFVRQFLSEAKVEDILVVGVSQAGASVHSASRNAREEFPELDLNVRTAISIARRFQDPLAELVKIDPKSIGVGQYQHDVDQKALHRALVQTLESCVNSVGVELNEASPALLRYVAGVADRLARKIVDHRNSNGRFQSRAGLVAVPGMGEKNFLHAAGFLRIRGGESPLDATAVHPESYPVVEKMAASLGISLGELIGNKEAISKLKLEDFITDSAGLPTLQDIREELIKPGRDPRRTFALPKFREDVRTIGDLKTGMALEGRVTNVTNFGAFVDIGVRQDGLVHLSQMSNRFIRDPRDAVRVGDVVQVKVISVEEETKRIGLSIKALLPSVQRRPKKPRYARSKPGTPGPVQPLAPEGTTLPAAPSGGQVSEGDRT